MSAVTRVEPKSISSPLVPSRCCRCVTIAARLSGPSGPRRPNGSLLCPTMIFTMSWRNGSACGSAIFGLLSRSPPIPSACGLPAASSRVRLPRGALPPTSSTRLAARDVTCGGSPGLRDVAALAEAVVDGVRAGLDPGDAVVLERYQRWRRFDTMTMCISTDGLNRLFTNRSDAVRLARDLGLGLVDRVPALKRLFIREAAGLTGEVPKLLRGESLASP